MFWRNSICVLYQDGILDSNINFKLTFYFYCAGVAVHIKAYQVLSWCPLPHVRDLVVQMFFIRLCFV